MNNKVPFKNKENLPLVITISHQFGSGGSYIGQRLAEVLNFLYLDRELIVKAADKLGVLADDLVTRDERTVSNFEAFLKAYSFSDASLLDVERSDLDFIKDEDIFKAESEIITKISIDRPAVILGRGSSYILREHPNHLSLYVHGDINDRTKRISENHHLSEAEALRLVQNKDKERLHYIEKFTKENLYNANLYDLAINTSKLELDKAIKLILAYIEQRFNYTV